MSDSDSNEWQDIEDDDPEALRDASELLTTGYYYISRGEWPEAIEALTEARDLFDQLQEAEGSAESRLLIGFINYQQGEFKAALPFLASAQQQLASLQAWHRQAATLYLLAHCHLGLEKPSKAIYTLKLAAKIFQTHPPSEDPRRNILLPDWPTLQQLVTDLLTKLNQDHGNPSDQDS